MILLRFIVMELVILMVEALNKIDIQLMIIEFSKYLEQKVGLTELGFYPVPKLEEGNLFRYHRYVENRVDLLGISIYSYSNKRKQNGIFVNIKSIVKGVSFIPINDFFEKAGIEMLEPYWFSDEHYNVGKILSVNHPDFITQSEVQHPEISENICTLDNQINRDIADATCLILQKNIEKKILPFYDLYPDLQSVNDLIIEKFITFQELSNYMEGLIGFKKMVIMRLCNNSEYSNYINNYEEILRKEVLKNKDKYLPYLIFFLNLKNVLNNYSS